MCRWWRVSCGSAHFVTLLAATAIVSKGTTRVVVRLAVVFSESSMGLPALEQLCALLAPVRLGDRWKASRISLAVAAWPSRGRFE